MDWSQIWTLAGVNIALIVGMATLLIWAVGKVDSDVKSCSNDIKSIGVRSDSHAARLDQLYKMFAGLLKERK